MKLAEKGRFAPPPSLPEHAQRVSEALAAWPGVHARTHWRLGDEQVIDGADFYVDDEEIGHLHLEGEAHVATGLPLRKALVEAELAAPFHWNQKFVVHEIANDRDIERALWLFNLAYERARGTPDQELVARVRATLT